MMVEIGKQRHYEKLSGSSADGCWPRYTIEAQGESLKCFCRKLFTIALHIATKRISITNLDLVITQDSWTTLIVPPHFCIFGRKGVTEGGQKGGSD